MSLIYSLIGLANKLAGAAQFFLSLSMLAWVGYNAKDIEWAYFDHKLILSLGCESAMNVPVVYAGRLLGTMNLLDAAGHYKESDVARAEPFAALLIGPFLDAIAADPDIGTKEST